MSFEVFKDFIDKVILQRKINGRKDRKLQLVLHGGEPTLLAPDTLDKMLSYAVDNFKGHGIKYHINLQSNGTIIDEGHLKYLDKVDSVGISLDGIEDAFSLRSKDTKLADRVRSTMSLLEDKEIPYGVLSVITNRSIDNIESLRDIVGKSLKIFPVYDTQNINSEIEVPPKVFFDKITRKDLERKFYLKDNKSALNSQINRLFKRVLADILFEHSDRTQSTCNFKFCGSGLRIVSIQPDGSIHRCDRWSVNDVSKKEYYLSRLDYYDFLGIFQLKEALKFNYMLHKINKETGCDQCFARYACSWDCQSLHYSKYGEYGVDKKRVCPEIKELYRYVETNIIEILRDLAENEMTIHFDEDKIFDTKLRKHILMKENGIYCKIKQDSRSPKTSVKFSFCSKGE
jgi:radical SAM protein with 4Fe4S-binding SPASM domain